MAPCRHAVPRRSEELGRRQPARSRAAAPDRRWRRSRGSPSPRAPPTRPRVARGHAAAADRADGGCSHRRSRRGLVRRSPCSPRAPTSRVAPTRDLSASARWPVQPCRLCSRPSPLTYLAGAAHGRHGRPTLGRAARRGAPTLARRAACRRGASSGPAASACLRYWLHAGIGPCCAAGWLGDKLFVSTTAMRARLQGERGRGRRDTACRAARSRGTSRRSARFSFCVMLLVQSGGRAARRRSVFSEKESPFVLDLELSSREIPFPLNNGPARIRLFPPPPPLRPPP